MTATRDEPWELEAWALDGGINGFSPSVGWRTMAMTWFGEDGAIPGYGTDYPGTGPSRLTDGSLLPNPAKTP